jgi:hypothetical protein
MLVVSARRGQEAGCRLQAMREGPTSVSCLGPHGLHRMAYTEWGDPANVLYGRRLDSATCMSVSVVKQRSHERVTAWRTAPIAATHADDAAPLCV